MRGHFEFSSLVRCAAAFIILVAVLLTGGCSDTGESPPKLGVKNWKPTSIGGPIELRPLPPAREVLADYQQWLASDAANKARVYEATLQGATNQMNFSVRMQRGDTPLGANDTTFVSFIYRDPTNGEYEFNWHRRGRHNLDFFKLNQQSKTVWVRPIDAIEGSGIPRLQIVAFEGLEPGGLIAESGEKPK